MAFKGYVRYSLDNFFFSKSKKSHFKASKNGFFSFISEVLFVLEILKF